MAEKIVMDSNVEKLSTSGLQEFVVPVVNTEEIGADYTRAENAQTELSTVSENVKTILTEIESLRNLMNDGSWLGEFAEAYLEKIEKMKTDMEQIPPYIKAVSSDIAEYAATIKNIASKY